MHFLRENKTIMQSGIRVAILDMNNNTPNKGMGYIIELLQKYTDIAEYQVFDIRYKNEIPDLSFDVYISSGGPGSPLDFGNGWDRAYFKWIEDVMDHNENNPDRKKYIFFICHSFQVACIYFKVGEIVERPTMSFGIYPVDKTRFTDHDELMKPLPNPFFVADFRHYQVVLNDSKEFIRKGFRLLATEHKVSQVNGQVALMAIRFSPEVIGTQFHPEADAKGMIEYLTNDERKNTIINKYGVDMYNGMVKQATDPDKIQRTHDLLLPTFLERCIDELMLVEV